MSSELTKRIAQIRTTVEWLNMPPEDSRRVQAEHALADAARYSDQAENAIEIAVAALERPDEAPHDEPVGVLTREPVHPRASATVRGEVGRLG